MAEPIADKMREGVEQGVFPGGVLLVSYRGRTVHHAAYGAACLLPEPEPATVDTIYDLASLTKPLVTTTAVALLLADGRLSLEDRKSTRLNSSHGYISYAVFCLKKKKNYDNV